MENSAQVVPSDIVYKILDYHHDTCIKSINNVILPKDDLDINKEVCFFRITRLSFDEDYPHREAFENVLLSLDSTAFNLVYILSGTEKGIELYLGVVKNGKQLENNSHNHLEASNYGEIIAGAFEGNFGGSILEKLRGEVLNECVLSATKKYTDAGIIMGIPSENTNQKDSAKGFQGMDRLINSMLGLNWRLIIVAEPAAKSDISSWQHEAYRIYNAIVPWAKTSVQRSENSGTSHTDSENKSTAKGASFSKGTGTSHGTSHQSGSDGSNKGNSSNESSGKSTTVTEGKSHSASTNHGQSHSMTAEIVNKHAQEILKYMDEELLERIKQGLGRGMFKTAVYYMADRPSTANRLRVGIMSLFQGDSSTYSPLVAHNLNLSSGQNTRDALRMFQNISAAAGDLIPEQRTLLSYPCNAHSHILGTWLTAKEVSLLGGLPQKEIPGISVVEGVDFGLNANLDGDIALGTLMQKGRRLKEMPLSLPKDFLNKHTFIAGVTGSGKTTTCHRLLKEAGVPFLVIEPAKTEYRTLIASKHFGECVVFTVGDEEVAPLRFNPFELVAGENLSSHIDMLKATFTSAFPMEGSMPQLLEEAIYKCYENKGWNVDTSKNDRITLEKDYVEGDEFAGKYDVFPIISDFLRALEKVVKEKNFDSRLRDDYIGTLVSRFSNLRKGAKGRMLNTSHSLDFFKLAEKNVIIELEDLKSAEDKALIMGFILARLSAVIKQKHRMNKDYRHITLVEEAHRLLSKVEYGDSGSKKSAVETFTDLLAEVRKYGEGLIIVDQIPNKLASEVIKNTNTKIIHKLLARDDKETVGDAMLMDDKQKNFLSALGTGEAVVFTEKLAKPVHIAITPITDTNEAEILDDVVHRKYIDFMERTHQRILLDNEIVNVLYAMYNHSLNQYIATNPPTADSKLADTLHKFCQKYAEELSLIDVLNVLTKEKAKRDMGDDAFVNRLLVFTRHNLLGDSSVPPLLEIPLEVLTGTLKDMAKSY